MFCGKCGNQLNQGEKFCGKCGNSVHTTSVQYHPPVKIQPVATPKKLNKKIITKSIIALILTVSVVLGAIFLPHEYVRFKMRKALDNDFNSVQDVYVEYMEVVEPYGYDDDSSNSKYVTNSKTKGISAELTIFYYNVAYEVENIGDKDLYTFLRDNYGDIVVDENGNFQKPWISDIGKHYVSSNVIEAYNEMLNACKNANSISGEITIDISSDSVTDIDEQQSFKEDEDLLSEESSTSDNETDNAQTEESTTKKATSNETTTKNNSTSNKKRPTLPNVKDMKEEEAIKLLKNYSKEIHVSYYYTGDVAKGCAIKCEYTYSNSETDLETDLAISMGSGNSAWSGWQDGLPDWYNEESMYPGMSSLGNGYEAFYVGDNIYEIDVSCMARTRMVYKDSDNNIVKTEEWSNWYEEKKVGSGFFENYCSYDDTTDLTAYEQLEKKVIHRWRYFYLDLDVHVNLL